MKRDSSEVMDFGTIHEITRNIFGNDFTDSMVTKTQEKNTGNDCSFGIKDVKSSITIELDKIEPIQSSYQGRLGPLETVFDDESKSRYINLSSDKLTAYGANGFGTAHANAALFKGKWQYEVQLGANGVMQIGWCTSTCKFKSGSGVGDTLHSYAYDGCRQKKWNVATHNYGEAWLGGDIIGTTINLEEGTIEFFRNGFSMGIAFKKIQTGPGMAYFPGVSLANAESVIANFGSSPFKHPVAGFDPIQRNPLKEVEKARMILEWIKNLLNLRESPKTFSECFISHEATMLLFASVLFNCLSPLLSKTYIIEACIVPFIKRLVFPSDKKICDIKAEVKLLNTFLDYLWMFLDINTMSFCLSVIIECLSSLYRRIAYNVDYTHQRDALSIMLALVRHKRTRRYFLNHVFFDTVMIHNFLHIKPLDDKALAKIIPIVWWEQNIIPENNSLNSKYNLDGGGGGNKTIEDDCLPRSIDPESEFDNNEDRKTKYYSSCKIIYDAVTEIELIQLELLKVLFTNDDGTETHSSSRKLFLENLRQFLLYLPRSLKRNEPQKVLAPTLLSCFYRLLALLQNLWEQDECATPVAVPVKVFYDDKIKYLNFERLGGVIRYLMTTFRSELDEALGTVEESNEVTGTGPSTGTPIQRDRRVIRNAMVLLANDRANIFSTLFGNPRPDQRILFNIDDLSSGNINRANVPPSRETIRVPPGNQDSQQSLVELLDSIILLYSIAANKQLVKVATIKTNMKKYTECFSSYKNKLKTMDPMSQIAIQLEHSCEVLKTNINTLGRHIAWILGAIYSDNKQSQIIWLLKSVILTLQESSKQGVFFSFVPCFYVESMLEISTILRSHFDPLVSFTNVPDSFELLRSISEFLASHFADPRIVHIHAKDILVQYAASFMCSPTTLKSMESITPNSMKSFVQALLRPYEGRSWASSNWILVRIWHGTGFAYRYKQSPHLSNIAQIASNDSNMILQYIEPCPSEVYQQEIKKQLLDENNQEMASAFLNSLLNQLNRSFSELIEMIQEIQNLLSRNDRVLLENRQLRICATCFDLSVCLLRVLEMIVRLARPLFTDQDRLNSTSLLERLCQVLCQLLNRSTTGGFNYIVHDINVAQLQTIHHFPILSAIMGILTALLGDEIKSDEEFSAVPTVMRALLSEPSFQMSSVKFMLSDMNGNTSAADSSKIPFTFETYKNEVLEAEIQVIRHLIQSCESNQRRLSVVGLDADDENMCSICYAAVNAARFDPCNHESCRSCITHHLMNNKLCFFCKTRIQKVVFIDGGEVLHDLSESSVSLR